MRRQDFLGLVLGASAVWPARALSQQAERVYRIGVLVTSPRTTDINVGFIDELNKLGFIEGKNLVIMEQGFGKNRDQFATVAKEFVAARVDAIVASSGALAIRVAQAATTSIPIVGIADDMVLEGHVKSIANHGGNTTGLSLLAAQLDGKRQEILMELMPNARRMAAIYDAAFEFPGQLDELRNATRAKNVELLSYPARKPEDVVAALDARPPARKPSISWRARCSRSRPEKRILRKLSRSVCLRPIIGRKARGTARSSLMVRGRSPCSGSWPIRSQGCSMARIRARCRSNSPQGSSLRST